MRTAINCEAGRMSSTGRSEYTLSFFFHLFTCFWGGYAMLQLAKNTKSSGR